MPVNIDCAGEYIGVKLSVFDLPEVFGQGLVGERFGLPLTSFMPPAAPTLNVFSLVNPRFFHTDII